jgi:hypothetical protein
MTRAPTMETPVDYGMTPPNFNVEFDQDLTLGDRQRVIKQMQLAFRVNEAIAEFYVEMWIGGMRFSKDGNFLYRRMTLILGLT